MEQPHFTNNIKKPSRLVMLSALVVAFSLPFILVKSFPHKQHPINHESVTETIDYESAIRDAISQNEIKTNSKTETQAQPTQTINKATQVGTSSTTNVPQSPPKPQDNEWKTIKTRDKDTLSSVFNRAGLSTQTLQKIIQDNPSNKTFLNIKPGQEIQVQIKNQILQKMVLPYNNMQNTEITLERNRYVAKLNSRKMNSHNHYLTATVRGSLFLTARQLKIPTKLIQQMTEIFTWDIDFTKDVHDGDQFTIIYQAFYVEDKLVGTGDILSVSYRNRGRTFQAVRYSDHFGQSEYYTPQGTSLKKAFNRYPIRFSHISSSFSLARYHPILHYMRAHKGVDLAARIGTPIMATGSGRIEFIGRQNGYGNMIKIKHDGTYSTIYGHMLKFEKGLSKGNFVRRGQVIGYVGQSGLASGPHCHYEFHVKGQPRNPSTVDLPKGLAIAGRELTNFKAKTGPLLAQLKMYEQTHLAETSKSNGMKQG